MFATLAGDFPGADGPHAGAALERVVRLQVEAGLGVISDGRVHDLDGDVAAAWRATATAAARVAPGLAAKIAVRGPWVSAPGGDAGAQARALRPHLGSLVDAGCPWVEVHEPADCLPRDVAGAAAFGAAHIELLADLGDGVHASLAITGGNADQLPAECVFGAPYRSHLFDLVAGPENWRLIAVAPGDRGIILGVVDATGRRGIGLEEITWAVRYAASTGGRGEVRVGVAPSGGLAGLGPETALALLERLGDAVVALSGDREALLDRLDPRAIDARTAALGHAGRRDRAARLRSPGGGGG